MKRQAAGESDFDGEVDVVRVSDVAVPSYGNTLRQIQIRTLRRLTLTADVSVEGHQPSPDRKRPRQRT